MFLRKIKKEYFELGFTNLIIALLYIVVFALLPYMMFTIVYDLYKEFGDIVLYIIVGVIGLVILIYLIGWLSYKFNWNTDCVTADYDSSTLDD